MPSVSGLISLERWPDDDEAPPPAPDGFLYLDDAVSQLQQRLRIREKPAFKAILGRVADGSIRLWVKRLSRRTILTKGKIPEPIEIDPTEFRKSEHTGIYTRGSTGDHYRILLANDDFLSWMTDPDAPARGGLTAESVVQPSQSSPALNVRKRGPAGKADALARKINEEIASGQRTLLYFTDKGVKLETIARDYGCVRSTLAKALKLVGSK